RGFQIVQTICANESESLAILQLPEHLKKEASQFWLHPALMDGSLHTGMGLLLKKHGIDMPLSLPFAVGEVQIFHPLKDLTYGYATWAVAPSQDHQKNQNMNVHLLDKSGRVLVRIKDFVLRPIHRSASKAVSREAADMPKSTAG